MGDPNVRDSTSAHQLRAFTRTLLEDLQALERLLEEGRIESGVRRIGAEVELFLLTSDLRPSHCAAPVLQRLADPRFTPELALFNLEANLSARPLVDDSLRRMEAELDEIVNRAREAAIHEDAQVLLAGILPTARQKELTLEAMTPNPRFRQINELLRDLRGGEFNIFLKGLDELQVTHPNIMFEACNTSFQIHFQVDPESFADTYNRAQLVSGPVLAAAVNSPTFLQHRLWQETRVGLFQQSLDGRSAQHAARQTRQRVSFGERWVDSSVLEIFKEDVARLRILLSVEEQPSSLEMVARGEIPPLAALCLHNGTVYRWNRPVYGVSGGKAHLRIEHRMLPAGPSVVDMVANAAFFFGLMSAVHHNYGDVRQVLAFDAAKENFTAAARYGLNARLQWVDGRVHAADRLILETLIPLAKDGLSARGVRSEDIERYLGVIEERARSGQTGARWALDSLAAMHGEGTIEQRYRVLTSAMIRHQLGGRPVHEWPLQTKNTGIAWRETCRTVEQIMSTDLFTVQQEDLVDLAANLMDWENIRHVPVEDHAGRLVGLVSHRRLLQMIARGLRHYEPVAVQEIMVVDPPTVHPETTTVHALKLMREGGLSCLPVVDAEGRLVGLVTERDFLHLTSRLLEERFALENPSPP